MPTCSWFEQKIEQETLARSDVQGIFLCDSASPDWQANELCTHIGIDVPMAVCGRAACMCVDVHTCVHAFTGMYCWSAASNQSAALNARVCIHAMPHVHTVLNCIGDMGPVHTCAECFVARPQPHAARTLQPWLSCSRAAAALPA